MENLGAMIGNTQKSLNPRAKRFFKQRPVFYKITVSQLYSPTIIKFTSSRTSQNKRKLTRVDIPTCYSED